MRDVSHTNPHVDSETYTALRYPVSTPRVLTHLGEDERVRERVALGALVVEGALGLPRLESKTTDPQMPSEYPVSTPRLPCRA